MALSDMEHLCLEVVRMVFTSSGEPRSLKENPVLTLKIWRQTGAAEEAVPGLVLLLQVHLFHVQTDVQNIKGDLFSLIAISLPEP